LETPGILNGSARSNNSCDRPSDCAYAVRQGWLIVQDDAVTILVMAGGFDISRANPFRQGGEQRRSVGRPLEAP
jgi:hypothetical protein